MHLKKFCAHFISNHNHEGKSNFLQCIERSPLDWLLIFPAERVVSQISSIKYAHARIIKSFTWPNLSSPSYFRSSLVFSTHCGFLLFCWKFNFNEFSNSLFIRLFLWRHWIMQWRSYMDAERKHNQGSLWVLQVFNQEELIAKPNANFDNWFKWNQVFQSSPWDWFQQERAWFC